MVRREMTHSLSQLAKLDESFWFCLKAHPKREHLAAEQLRRQLAVECYSPRLRFRKSTQRGAVWYIEAMFPGYLFAYFNFAKLNRAVLHSPGVQQMVRFGEQVATVDPSLIEMMRREAAENEVVTVDPQLDVGHPVRIVEGPLRGIEALVTQVLPAKERVRVLLEFLGRSVEMEIATPGVLSVKPIRSNLSPRAG